MLFSIIIPSYNSEKYLSPTLTSALNQLPHCFEYEVILIDDCSSDGTLSIASEFNQQPNFHIHSTIVNSGPGIARNCGVNSAIGDWIVYLDSDDLLRDDALLSLASIINGVDTNVDAIGFNFENINNIKRSNSIRRNGRCDANFLKLAKNDLIKKYLSMSMDGSVIYTAMRREMLLKNNIKFSVGLHEDVDYIFKVYMSSRSILYLDETIYLKRDRLGSIVNSTSVGHIEGYIRAWNEVWEYTLSNHNDSYKNYIGAFRKGITGFIGSAVLAIHNNATNIVEKSFLYKSLYKILLSYFHCLIDRNKLPCSTKYDSISNFFLLCMADNSLTDDQKFVSFNNYIEKL